MEYVVPRLKMGVFADLAREAMERSEEHGDAAQLRSDLAKAWDSVDNRMGQLVYDNLFWNKTVKDLAMGSTRSVGWNVGAIREITGGVFDALEGAAGKAKGKPYRMSTRTAYVIGLTLLMGVVGAVIHRIMTGENPKELKDIYFPRRGPRGTPGWNKRMSFPSYVKDIAGWAHSPYDTARGKIHPLLTLISEMLSNKDYFDRPIRNPNDPIVKQIEAYENFVTKGNEPIALRTLTDHKKGPPETTAEKVLPFIGITEAPKYIKDEGTPQTKQTPQPKQHRRQ